MKNRLFMRNRRGRARRSVGFSFVIVMVMSLLLGFAAQITTPSTAHAAPADIVKYRRLVYLDQCLKKYVDFSGKLNDRNDENPEFENLGEMWAPAGNGKEGSPGEYLAVGQDFDSKNGVVTCLSLAEHAVPVLQETIQDTSGRTWQEFLMDTVWGKRLNGGTIPAEGAQSEARNRSRVDNFRTLVLSLAISRYAVHRTKTETLQRMAPMFNVCFKSLQTSAPSDESWGEGSLTYGDLDFFAQQRSFSWDDDIIKNVVEIKSTYTRAVVGHLGLGFATWGGTSFKALDTPWYPVGRDMANVLGVSNLHYMQADQGTVQGGGHGQDEYAASCDVFSKKKDFFFKNTVHYFVKDNRLHIGTGPDDPNAIDVSNPDDGGDGGGGGDGNSDPEPEDTTCKIDGAIGWIISPICTITLKATESVGGYIATGLEVPAISQSGGNNDAYVAWKTFRDIANALLVIVFLIAIFYQVLPIQVDAYTVKKVLPRLIIATIAIQASFFICQVAIDIANVLGGGVREIFASLSTGGTGGANDNINIFNIGFSAVVLGGVAIALVGPVIFLILGGLISLVTVFITIQAREMILILLVIVSPIAFLAGVLPNTESWFKKWSSNFVKLLLMYPIIQVILSGSFVIAQILSSSGGSSPIQQVMASFIPVIALFMVPATFKASGTLMGTVGGAISGKGFGYARGLRGQASRSAKGSIKGVKDNWQRSRAVSGANKDYGTIRRFGNRALSGAGLAGSFRLGQTAKHAQAQRAEAGLKEKVGLINAELTEKGLNGDNAQLLKWLNNEKEDGTRGKKRSKAERIAALQMLGENGGVEELSNIYEEMEAENEGKKSSEWKPEDRDVWQQGTTNSRQALARALPHSVRPDHDRAFGKLDAEGFASLKGAAGKQRRNSRGELTDSHIEAGLKGIQGDIAQARQKRADAIARGAGEDSAEVTAIDDTIANKQAQLQKAFTSMVGVGQSTDRRGRIDADNVKAFARAVNDGVLDGTSKIKIGDTEYTAKKFVSTFVNTETGQLRAVSERASSGSDTNGREGTPIPVDPDNGGNFT